MKFNEIPTPAYVCDEALLRQNLELLKSIENQSGAKVLCALKGFAFSPAMPLTADILSGATCSGLHEAKYAKECGFKQISTFNPAFKDCDIDEIIALSDDVIFNSLNQLNRFAPKVKKAKKSVGLRVNPNVSFSPTDAYNPCGAGSRLGVLASDLKSANSELLAQIDGVHFHALCEQGAGELAAVLEVFERDFGKIVEKIQPKWINLGGGHHITKKGYDTHLLIDLLKNLARKFKAKIIIEPGEAVGWQAGYLVASVLDIVENGAKTAIIDASAECHMPDTELMPYRPALRGEVSSEKILAENEPKNAFKYRFGGATCLAGDVVGLRANEPDYYLLNELKIGDRVIFEDQIHYTNVKNTTFNGTPLPCFVLQNGDDFVLCKEFDYNDFKRRS